MKSTSLGEDTSVGVSSGQNPSLDGDLSVGGGIVIVGLKLDATSKELLTWALVKVAESGDRVIAIHVIKPGVSNAGKSTLISLVRSFDSVLAAYEGFCHLKQVDLKLKVCRGSSVREMLVREAKSHSSAKVIVGTSRTNHMVRPISSVAQYCSRKLSTDYWILGVDNGKVLYQRKPKNSKDKRLVADDHKPKISILSTHRSPFLGMKVQRAVTSCSESKEDYSSKENLDNTLALIPVQEPIPETIPCSTSKVLSCDHHLMKPGCQLFRRRFLLKKRSFEKFSIKNIFLSNWLAGSSSLHCSSTVYPDKKNNNVVTAPLGSNNTGHSRRIPEELECLEEKYSAICRLFSYGEILSLTSNFMYEKIVGRGGNSQVYRSCLPDGRELAIKLLKPSENALKEFLSEINIITTLHHKNIISLFGFCFEENNLLLVYDFLSRGSLEDNLHGCKKDGVSFGWKERYKVALGVAEALDYLHNIAAQPVIHKDVKSSNILLLDDYEPLLSDFGLATFCSIASSHLTCTDVAGTFGYLAPEYFVYGKVDEKVDVYAFGVVLLELLSGRKPINGQESLVTWAKQILKIGEYSDLLDPTLLSGDGKDRHKIEGMVLGAALCIRTAHRLRPPISRILKLLRGEMEVVKWAKEEVEAMNGEVCGLDMKSHLTLALQDLEEDSVSSCSTEQSIIPVEDYLRGRWSRSLSFN